MLEQTGRNYTWINQGWKFNEGLQFSLQEWGPTTIFLKKRLGNENLIGEPDQPMEKTV